MTDQRSEEAKAWRKLYNSARWKRLRQAHLDIDPLCVFCRRQEIVEIADVLDHITPHKGDVDLFFDPNNLQGLCFACHDSTKQRIELGQTIVSFGLDGWPV